MTEFSGDFGRFAEEQGLVEITLEPLWLPESTPQFPFAPGAESSAWKAETVEQKEISAAHLALDALGVPRTKELSEEERTGGVRAIHDLRLHGRLRLLGERIQEQNIDIRTLFPED
jgi:hypothetical protein